MLLADDVRAVLSDSRHRTIFLRLTSPSRHRLWRFGAALATAAVLAAGCSGSQDTSSDADVEAGVDHASSDAGAAGFEADGRDSGGGGAVTATDDAGDVVRLSGPARRVVSLVPSVTDVVLELGLADRLIARTSYDIDPRLAALPSVGPGLTPNLEWLAAREPDLVIAWRDAEGRGLVDRLRDLDVAVYVARLEDVPTALSTISRIGALLGEPARGDSLRAAIEARLDSVAAASDRDSAARPSVLYMVGSEPAYAPGSNTFVDDLIRIAGGASLFADLGSGWHSVSVEAVVHRDPDVIVIPVHDAEAGVARDLAGRPGWRSLRAVREGRVLEVDGELFGRPGPRLGEAAALLSELLRTARLGDGDEASW